MESPEAGCEQQSGKSTLQGKTQEKDKGRSLEDKGIHILDREERGFER